MVDVVVVAVVDDVAFAEMQLGNETAKRMGCPVAVRARVCGEVETTKGITPRPGDQRKKKQMCVSPSVAVGTQLVTLVPVALNLPG